MEEKQKQVIPVERAANWYFGNYLMNPNNSLRENENLLDEAFAELEKLKEELKGTRLTHKQFLDLTKERGIHGKYYHYQKYEPPRCALCEKLGIRQHWHYSKGRK